MASKTQKVDRLGNALGFLDGTARKAIAATMPDADGKAITAALNTVRNADVTVPKVGDRVSFGPIFAGTPFAGVSGTVTPSGIVRDIPRAGKRSVIVALDATIGASKHYPVPAGYLASVEVSA